MIKEYQNDSRGDELTGMPQKRRTHFWYRRKKTVIIFVSSFLLLMVGGVAAWKHIETKPNLNSVDVVKQKISAHMLLPQNEKPALATVIDKNRINKQLFSEAENGDKILIYQNNKKLIIYRPKIDRIVDIKPIAIDKLNDSK